MYHQPVMMMMKKKKINSCVMISSLKTHENTAGLWSIARPQAPTSILQDQDLFRSWMVSVSPPKRPRACRIWMGQIYKQHHQGGNLRFGSDGIWWKSVSREWKSALFFFCGQWWSWWNMSLIGVFDNLIGFQLDQQLHGICGPFLIFRL